MQTIDLKTYKLAKLFADVTAVLHEQPPMPTEKWYEFLSDIDNPKYDWKWGEDEKQA